jgi:prepilin-type processing-associated H-X9-DG protein
MQILVVLAILVILLVIAVPIYHSRRMRVHQQAALDKIRTLGGAMSTYANQNGGALPAEDTGKVDSWANAAKPEAKDVWYNALPRLLGKKGVGDYASSTEAFYTDENLLFLPGGNYPDKKKLSSPQFAVAFNTKLQRTEANGEKPKTLLSQITQPGKTVGLLEQGLLNEGRTLEVQSKKDYDGSPKGSAKSFVGRYAGKGVLWFFDGHVELVAVKDALTEMGTFPFPQTNVVWTRNPEENPNKDGVQKSQKEKEKKK